jgi:hypothetical protein
MSEATRSTRIRPFSSSDEELYSIDCIKGEREMANTKASVITKDDIGGFSAKERILALARAHGVVYRPDPLDDLADAITRLAGDDIELDDTELLLLALERAGYVSTEEADRLHVAYMRQRSL